MADTADWCEGEFEGNVEEERDVERDWAWAKRVRREVGWSVSGVDMVG